MNKQGQALINKQTFIDYMRDAYEDGRLYVNDDGDVYMLVDEEGYVVVTMDVESGMYTNTKAGNKKSNKRQYINIDGLMRPNYEFRIVAEGLLAINNEAVDRFEYYEETDCAEINHMNGNTLDNRFSNLEVTTKALNRAHSRFMSEAAEYYPDLFIIRVDCQGRRMHSWVDNVGISCKQVAEWNSENDDMQIMAFKNPNGEWRPHFEKSDVAMMLRFFGKIA